MANNNDGYGVKYVSLNRDQESMIMDWAVPHNPQEQADAPANTGRPNTRRPNSFKTVASKDWKCISLAIVFVTIVVLAVVTIYRIESLHRTLTRHVSLEKAEMTSIKYESLIEDSVTWQTTSKPKKDIDEPFKQTTASRVPASTQFDQTTNASKGYSSTKPANASVKTCQNGAYVSFTNESVNDRFSKDLLKLIPKDNSSNSVAGATNTTDFKERIVYQIQTQEVSVFPFNSGSLINDGFVPGDKIRVYATACNTRDSNGNCYCAFNFDCALNVCSDKRDILFHLSVRIDLKQRPQELVENALFCGQWGTEERDAPSFPFAEGKYFQIEFILNSDRTDVFVDDIYLTSFTHRRSLSECNLYQFRINGPITLHQVYVVKSRANRSITSTFVFINDTEDGTTLKHNIPVSLNPNDRIYVLGIPTSTNGRFTLAFQCGATFDNDTIPFLLTVCLNCSDMQERVVVSNRLFGNNLVMKSAKSRNGTSSFQFQNGVPFELLFVVKPGRFEVYFDSVFFGDFFPIVPVASCMDTLYVDGDISLKTVRFK